MKNDHLICIIAVTGYGKKMLSSTGVGRYMKCSLETMRKLGERERERRRKKRLEDSHE
jgi:ferredoxin-fold anticodon binding domain-containing protein